MTEAVVLWADIPEDQRADDRPCPIWGTPVTHRGCAGAVRWPDGQGWHRCASSAIKKYGLCRKHAERTGVIPDHHSGSNYPRGLDNRVGNTIARNVKWRSPGMTVEEFRRLSDADIRGWRNTGRAAIPSIRTVRDTWPDEDLIRAFGLRASYWDTAGDFAVCNWVGEGVPA